MIRTNSIICNLSVPGTMLSAEHVLFCLLFILALWGIIWNEETKTLKSVVISQKLISVNYRTSPIWFQCLYLNQEVVLSVTAKSDTH